MAIESYFFNAVKTGTTYDRVYSAQDFTDYLELLVGNGVFPNPSSQLQVLANGGMTVKVTKGQGWIAGHKMKNTADLILTIDSSDVLLNRIDRVVFYVDYSLRDMGIDIKKGTNATTPTPPSLTRSTQRWELCLAEININKQVASIVQSAVRDTRISSELCGFVQGLVQQASTETLFNQWNTANTNNIATNQEAFATSLSTMETSFDEFVTISKDTYDKWFESIKTEILKNTLVTQKIKSETISYDIAVGDTWHTNITSYYPDCFNINRDILNVYLNGLRLIKDIEYTCEAIQLDETIDMFILKFKKPIQKGNVLEYEIFKCIDETK